MNKILIIDDNNELTLPKDTNYKKISSDSNELFTLKNIEILCINRNIKMFGIIQLVRLINETPNYFNTQIVVVTHWIRNYEKLCLSRCNINRYITFNDFNQTLIEEIKSQTSTLEESIKIQKDVEVADVMFKLVYSHNSKENMINRYILDSALTVNSLEQTIKNFFFTLNTNNTNDIIIIILKEGSKTQSYSWIDDSIKKPCFDDFIKFCFHNYHDNFNGVNIEGINNLFLNNISEDRFNSMDIENKRISSYYYSPIYNGIGEPIGTVHVGNFINNYFNNSEIREKLSELFYRIGEPIDNAIQFKQANDIREKNLNVFSKFIPVGVINKLLQQGEIKRTGEVRRICVLFSDIRSFTTISERNSAENVVKLLNNYFNIMVKCIKDQGGTIDKFIGDAIMAMFGAPDDINDIEEKAVLAAKNMINSLDKIDTQGIILPDMGFKIGIGLHVGDSIVGNIGSEEKKAYTSIGDIATIAEELEGLTKKYKKPILVTSDVAKFCNSKIVDSILVDGKTVEIHSVMESK